MQRVLEPEVMDTAEEVATYDAMDHSTVNELFVQRLKALGVNGLCLDIGCGTGLIPLQLVAACPEVDVVAMDLSKHMLQRALEHQQSSENGEQVEFVLADAKKIGAEDDSFDSVFSNSILHHIPEPIEFINEAWRVLKPGGAFLIRDLFRPPSKERARELVKMYAGEESEYAQQLFYDSLCAALRPEELEEIATAAGIKKYQVTIDSDRHMSLQVKARSY
ncbi:MAG: class I SAM-dependent methyltransferase [Planctomycetota bacterium]|jgi:ubiquinone/menaquinone biosynthesis C-methylase UbiE|nr:class I SAM-dependent methyltransferase [Planctomycetota bacterium]